MKIKIMIMALILFVFLTSCSQKNVYLNTTLEFQPQNKENTAVALHLNIPTNVKLINESKNNDIQPAFSIYRHEKLIGTIFYSNANEYLHYDSVSDVFEKIVGSQSQSWILNKETTKSEKDLTISELKHIDSSTGVLIFRQELDAFIAIKINEGTLSPEEMSMLLGSFSLNRLL